jgi:hypothetical protein
MSYNKNLKLYIQNINKTSRKEYYHQSELVYLNEIYEINRKITQEGVPLEDMLDEIEYLKKKFNVLKNKDKSNNYLTLLNLKDTVTFKNNAITYENLYNDASSNLVIKTQQLIEKTQELEYVQSQLNECLLNGGNLRRGFKIKEVNTNVNTSIKKEYIIYIQQYGMPSDGLFIESILEFIRDTYNL